jgi:hypothetical protein
MNDVVERIWKEVDVTARMGVALTLEMLCSNLGRAQAALTFVSLLKSDGICTRSHFVPNYFQFIIHHLFRSALFS